MVTLAKANHDFVELHERDEPQTLVLTSATAASGTYGVKYAPKLDSGRVTVILAGNSSADVSVTIAAGDTQFGLAKTITVPKDGMVTLNIDGGKHKNILGANKGYIILTASAVFSAAAIENAF